jgi:hypothetical protein
MSNRLPDASQWNSILLICTQVTRRRSSICYIADSQRSFNPVQAIQNSLVITYRRSGVTQLMSFIKQLVYSRRLQT